MKMFNRVECIAVLLVLFPAISAWADPQYKSEAIEIVAASADEPVRNAFSLDAAAAYLEGGATAWNQTHGCVTCHTNGSYMQIAPSLTAVIGKPSAAHREFFVQQAAEFQAVAADALKQGVKPTQIAYVAHGLASWDAHVTGELSEETRQALQVMLSAQADNGSWGNTQCWPPFESSSYHGSTVAALAMATAPGFLEQLNEEQAGHVELLKKYLRETPPPHDYGRVLLLWTATQIQDLLSEQRQAEIIKMIRSHQQEDGGWSIRSFSLPDDWGNGNRAEKLRAEPEFNDPPSDGHQTGLAVMVLREAGVAVEDPAIQNAIDWITSNQRESGRWWTRSLNTDGPHFITYSSTLYALAALHKCGKLAE
jgi:squalene-hopene/tetraprenyl-beta-curcumene cyclase